MKYTPGPWKLAASLSGQSLCISADGWPANIAVVAKPVGRREEGEANAQLIKAAPDMYEALATLENDDGSIPEFVWEMRNAALKKARGES